VDELPSLSKQDCQLYRTVDEVTSASCDFTFLCDTVLAAARDAHSNNDSHLSSPSWQSAILSYLPVICIWSTFDDTVRPNNEYVVRLTICSE